MTEFDPKEAERLSDKLRYVPLRDIDEGDPVMDEASAMLRAAIQKVHELTQGSAWRDEILTMIYSAEVSGRLKELVDEQLQSRLQDLIRTEEKYHKLTNFGRFLDGGDDDS